MHAPVIDPSESTHVIGLPDTTVPLIDTDVSIVENPLPVTVTDSPITPVLGVSVMLGTVTVNEFVAASAGTLATSDPDAVTVVPLVPEGTLNVQLNAPVPLADSDPLVQLEIDTLSNVSVIVVETVKPLPVVITDSPTTP